MPTCQDRNEVLAEWQLFAEPTSIADSRLTAPVRSCRGGSEAGYGALSAVIPVGLYCLAGYVRTRLGGPFKSKSPISLINKEVRGYFVR